MTTVTYTISPMVVWHVTTPHGRAPYRIQRSNDFFGQELFSFSHGGRLYFGEKLLHDDAAAIREASACLAADGIKASPEDFVVLQDFLHMS